MDGRLRDLLEAHDGVCTTGQAAPLGLGDRDLRRAIRDGELVRVRRAAFVDAERYAAAPPSEQFRLRVRAVLASRPDTYADRHAGLAVHGLPLMAVDLGRIDLVAPTAHPNGRAGIRVRSLDGGEVLGSVGGDAVVSPAGCLVGTAASSGVLAGLVAVDAALHREIVTLDEVAAAADARAPRVGRGHVAEMIRLADGRSESPGETRTRLLLLALGLPFEPQVSIADLRGRFVGRVDFLVAGRVVVEFDGAVKYAGAEGRDALIREKAREDALRALGYEVIRLTWGDLERPAMVARMLRIALSRATAVAR